MSGKGVGPARQIRSSAVGDLDVHGPEKRADDLVRIGRVALAHLLDGSGEQAATVEDVRIFGEEAEDEAGHEVIHVVPPRLGGPLQVFPQKLDIELVELPGGPHVDGVVLDLLDGGDARRGRKKPKCRAKSR